MARLIALFAALALVVVAAAGPINEPVWRSLFKAGPIREPQPRFLNSRFAGYEPITLPPIRVNFKTLDYYGYNPAMSPLYPGFLAYYHQAYPYQYYGYPQHFSMY